MKKILLAILALVCIASAQSTATTLLEQVNIVQGFLMVLMLTMAVLAAVVFVIGQLFGAETRARATTWAKSMLTAVGVSALLVALLFVLLPNFKTPTTDPKYFENTINGLSSIAQSSLIGLIILLVVISALVYALGQATGAETRARATVWSTGILAGALVAAVIYVIFFQILTSFQGSFFGGMLYGLDVYGPKVIIPIAFFVTALILITYLIAKVSQVPEWEAYLNIELSNLAGTFLIMLFVLGFFGAGAIFSFMVTGNSSPTDAAADYLTTHVTSNVLEGMYDVFRIQTCTSMLNVFMRRIGEAVLTNVFKVFPGIDVFVNITNVIGYGLVAIYASLQFQLLTLRLIDAFALQFLLPAGLIMRFFPPTRDAGSFLIALAFAFQFVFPMVYLINGQVVEYLGIQTYDKAKSDLIIQSLCGPFKYGVMGVLFNPLANVPVVSSFPGLQSLFKVILSEATLNLLSMAEFVPIMRSLSLLSLFALFMPAFALVISLTFINAMTKFLTFKV